MSVPASDWLSQGGAYTIVFVQTGIIIVAGWVVAMKIGSETRSEGDGCLLGIANSVLAALGAGLGFFATQYPFYVLSSLVGAATLSWFGTWWLARRIGQASAKKDGK